MDGSLLAALMKRRASQRTTSLPYGDTSVCSAILHACVGEMLSLKTAAMCQFLPQSACPNVWLQCLSLLCLLQSNACPGPILEQMHKPHVLVWQATVSRSAHCHPGRLVWNFM